mmetsp:Transcript_12938/g.23012  ORF Transcript_12938/g.23012 Transcript_12938/m.23012 type:complete len:242 (-) Transcript_12938:608-1333(-)
MLFNCRVKAQLTLSSFEYHQCSGNAASFSLCCGKRSFNLDTGFPTSPVVRNHSAFNSVMVRLRGLFGFGFILSTVCSARLKGEQTKRGIPCFSHERSSKSRINGRRLLACKIPASVRGASKISGSWKVPLSEQALLYSDSPCLIKMTRFEFRGKGGRRSMMPHEEAGVLPSSVMSTISRPVTSGVMAVPADIDDKEVDKMPKAGGGVTPGVRPRLCLRLSILRLRDGSGNSFLFVLWLDIH